MYQVDIGNNIVGSTATNYTQGAAAFTNWMDVFMPTATYLETDEPRAPPRQDRLYALGVHQEFISSNLYTRAEGGWSPAPHSSECRACATWGRRGATSSANCDTARSSGASSSG